MAEITMGRFTALRTEPFAVFIIGMRINRPWKVRRWAPVAAAMPRMLKEIHPELGFLGGRVWFARTILMIQYWRSSGGRYHFRAKGAKRRQSSFQ